MANRLNLVEDRLIAAIDAKKKLLLKPATATIAEVLIAKHERKAKRVPLVPYSARITIGQRTQFLAKEETKRKDMLWKNGLDKAFSRPLANI